MATDTKSGRKTSSKKRGGSAAQGKAAKAAQEKAAKAREQKRAEAEKARAAARKKAIADGQIIEGEGNVEFHRVENGSDGEVVKRAREVIKRLEASKTPVPGRKLMAELGGGWPQYLAIFSLLKAQGLVIEYRSRGGGRGTSGVAYLHTKHA